MTTTFILQESLKKALHHVQPVAGKTHIGDHNAPNLLISAKQDSQKITIVADAPHMIVEETLNAEINESFNVKVNAAIFYDMIRNLDQSTSAEITKEASHLSIKADKASFKLPYISTEDADISNANQSESYSSPIEITVETFKRLLDTVKASISKDELKYIYNCIYIHITEEEETKYITAVGTDGMQLTVAKSPIDLHPSIDLEDMNITLGKKALIDILSVLSDMGDDEIIKIHKSPTKIKIDISNIQIEATLTALKFPDYHNAIPKHDKKILMNKNDLKRALKIVSSVGSNSNSPIIFDIKGQSLYIRCESTYGVASDEVILKGNHEPVAIGLNSIIVNNFISQIKDDIINIEYKDEISTIALYGENKISSLHITNPKRISNQTDSADADRNAPK